MEKILLTGASGFIGQELERKLLGRKGTEIHELHEMERYVTGRYDHYAALKKDSHVAKHYVDLKDYHAVKTLIKKIAPDYIIHLAAISPVAYSYDNYIEVTEVNYIASSPLNRPVLPTLLAASALWSAL